MAMSFKPPVSLCMIVKNEAVFLDGALKSVNSFLGLDDLVVVDTGSTDNTREIAVTNGAKVFDFTWCDDFSAARNFASGKAENDWIFVLDADEEVTGADVCELDKFTADPGVAGKIVRIEKSNNEWSRISRLYNRTAYHYEGRIHEQVMPLDNKRDIREDVPIFTVHHGYLPEVMKAKGTLERNEKLLLEELVSKPDDTYLLYQLGKVHFTGGTDLPQACRYFKKVLSYNPDVRLSHVYETVECYGYALINSGQYEKALKLLERYVKHYKAVPQFRFLSAHIYQNNGMFIEAVECYESCIGADIEDYQGITSYLSYYNIGVILECVGMKEDAIQMYFNCGDYEPAKARLAEMLGKH